MCQIKSSTKLAATSGIEVSVMCKTSGKPITISNEYGMFCEDLCDLQKNKDATKLLQGMFPGAF